MRCEEAPSGRGSAVGADHILVRLGEGWISKWLTKRNEYNGVVAWQTGLDTVHLAVDGKGPTRDIITQSIEIFQGKSE